jgi:hypothetical protein
VNVTYFLFCCIVVMSCFCFWFLVISFFRSCMICAGNTLFQAIVNIVFHPCCFDCSVMVKVIILFV